MSSSLTDKVARESVDAQTSDHSMHDEAKGAVEHGDETDEVKENEAFKAHGSNKGPQISENMPKTEGSADELKAKAKDLNK